MPSGTVASWDFRRALRHAELDLDALRILRRVGKIVFNARELKV